MADDVELCLEVQVDPASKKILSNPEKCRSALLDVTIVKPKELEAFGTKKTNTLRADEVRKLLTSLEKQRRKKLRVLEKLKYDDTIIQIRKHENCCDSRHFSKRHRLKEDRIASSSPVDDLERKDFIGIAESVEPLFCEIRRSLKNVETRITNMQDINLVISQSSVHETVSEEFSYPKRKKRSPLTSTNGLKNQSVYRMETASHKLDSLLFSDNKQKVLNKCENIQGKCLCENCGIIGLLTECQKHPLLAELSESYPASEHNKPLKKKTRFNLLKSMENAKLENSNDVCVSRLSDRIKLLEQRLAMQEERVVPKDYFKKIITKMMTNLSPKLFKSKSDTTLHCADKKKVKSEKSSRHYSPCSDRTHGSRGASATKQRSKEHRTTTKNDKSTITDDDIYYSGYVWKWGEEVLRPGIDLKNKIVALLQEMLSKLTLNETKPKSTFTESVKNDEYNPDAMRKLVTNLTTKIYDAQVDAKPKFSSRNYGKSDKIYSFEPFHHSSFISDHSKKSCSSHNVNKKIDISYVNPKLSSWKNESHDKIEDNLPEQKNNGIGKQEFLKIVTKAKQHQKDILWTNIWNQAKANGQTKKDVITIKIPGQMRNNKGKPKMYETEISIGEVEKILKGS